MKIVHPEYFFGIVGIVIFLSLCVYVWLVKNRSDVVDVKSVAFVDGDYYIIDDDGFVTSCEISAQEVKKIKAKRKLNIVRY